MTNHFDDFDHDVLNILQIFVRSLSGKKGMERYLYVGLSNILSKELHKTPARKQSHPMRLGKMDKGTKAFSFWESSEKDILDFRSKQIAEQLTLIEFEYFKVIKPKDFIDGIKTGSKETVTVLRNMIDHFNDVTRWTEESILREERLKNRAKVLEKFIRIAKELRALNNFETLTAIISTLHSPDITRLKWTRASIPHHAQEGLNDLHRLMEAEKSYKLYRDALKEVTPPCIVYLGVLLRDLIYLEEGGTDTPKGTIPWSRKKTMYEHFLSGIQKFQSKGYELDMNPVLKQKLMTLPSRPKGKEESAAYSIALNELSQKREPRNCKRSDLI